MPRLSHALRATFAFAFGAGCAVAAPRRASAQGDVSKEGAAFLLVPIGASVVGGGQAVVASEVGATGVWWNPASIARMRTKEFTLDYSHNFIADGLALSSVFPAGRAGVFAVGAYILDLGTQEATDQFGTIGTILPRDYVFDATYAATMGRHVSLGVSYKFIQQRTDCTGACGNLPLLVSSGGAVDIGMQVAVDSARRLVIGAAVRNAGSAFQVNDIDQADPLPTRLHLGARYLVPGLAAKVPDGELALMGEVAMRPAGGNTSWRGGAEFAFKKQVFLRAGYAGGSGDLAGATIGIGARRGALSFDFARAFGGVSSDAGAPPTYVTLRFAF